MFTPLEDQFLDDAVTRAEQSRTSYSIQTEEFRTLNANLQTYVVDMQTIDEQNRQLQEKIEQIRQEYILALETHLERLPGDFREQSQTLTAAHLERYRSKSRAKRFLKERDELKRRINFVASDEKEQAKRLKALQKQERLVSNEFNKLNQHIQSVLTYVENEKQNYRNATEKVDHLQIQLERISVERSQTEFEIQTLKEEVKLMQTTREFLDDERETLVATRAEANEDLLSRLSESVDRIRNDFDQLNRAQLKQAENEYKQMMQLLEENLLAEETPTTESRDNPVDSRRLHDEQRAVLQELTTLQETNEALTERAYAMEADLHSLRDERRQQLTSKDNELERSQLELQTLSEKLNHLAEYDRNLQFELTLYRGVLESEYRRKQSVISTMQLTRPTTLRSNTNTRTDRTARVTNTTARNTVNDSPLEENLTSRHRILSDYDPLLEDTNTRTSDARATATSTSDDSGPPQVTEPLRQETQQDVTSTTDARQSNELYSTLPTTTVPEEVRTTSVSEAQPVSSRTSSTSTPTRQSPTSSAPPLISREEESDASQLQRSSTLSPELHSSPSSLPFVPTSAIADETSVSVDDRQSPPTTERTPSPTPSVDLTAPSDTQRRSSTATAQTPPDERQPSSRTSSVSSAAPTNSRRRSSVTSVAPPADPELPTPREASTTEAPPSDTQRRSSIAPLPTGAEQLPSSRKSSVSSPVSSDVPRRPSTSGTSTSAEQPLSTALQEHQASSPTSSVDSPAITDDQQRRSTTDDTVVPQQQSSSDAHETAAPATTPEAPANQTLLSDQTSAESTSTSNTQRRSSTIIDPTTTEDQPSSRTSSIGSAVPSDVQRRVSIADTPTNPEQQAPSIPSPEPQSSSHKASLVDSRRPSTVNISAASEQLTTAAEARQTPPSSPHEYQPSSRTSSVSSVVSSDLQRRLSAAGGLASSEQQPSSRKSSVDSTVQYEAQRHPSAAADASVLKHQLPPASYNENQSSSRSGSVSLTSPADTETTSASDTQATEPKEQPSGTPAYEYQSSPRSSSARSSVSFDSERRSSIVNSATIPEHQPPADIVTASASTTEEQPAPTPLLEDQPSSHTSSRSSAVQSEISPVTATAHSPSSRKSSVESVQPLDTERSIISTTETPAKEEQRTAPAEVPSSSQTERTADAANQSNNETSDKTEQEAVALPVIDERSSDSVDQSQRRPSTSPFEHSSTEEYEVSLATDSQRSRSSSLNFRTTPREERKPSLSQSDSKSEFKTIEPSDQPQREEGTSSSLASKAEDSPLIDFQSSAKTADDQSSASRPIPLQETIEHTSTHSSLTDVEEDASALGKSDNRVDDDDDPNLAIIIQELRYVFHELANNADLVEIDQNLPDKLLERLEFRDQLIRTLFDSLLRKYLVQAAAQGSRPSTLDWTEFRDILFPMISGRYTERHIRKLFDLFDVSGDGHLSVQEIAELLEVLQASDTIHLAQNIVDAYDTDHDGKLSADELIEAIKKTDDINEHVLSTETENQQWFSQASTENETTTLEVPVAHFPKTTDGKFTDEISLLGRIFKDVGANADSKQLDSTNSDLPAKLADEFIENHIRISNADLQQFIQLFLNKKQRTDSSVSWTEFRDTFLPIVNHGSYTKNDLKRWFEILDSDQNGTSTREQVGLLLRLLQIQNPEEVLRQLNESRGTRIDGSETWTLDELTTALNSIEETSAHLLTGDERIEHIASFDTDWLAQNIF